MLTVKDVAAELNVGISTVYALVAKKMLACHRIGVGCRGIRVSQEALSAYLATTKQSTRQDDPPPPRRKTLKHIRL